MKYKILLLALALTLLMIIGQCWPRPVKPKPVTILKPGDIFPVHYLNAGDKIYITYEPVTTLELCAHRRCTTLQNGAYYNIVTKRTRYYLKNIGHNSTEFEIR